VTGRRMVHVRCINPTSSARSDLISSKFPVYSLPFFALSYANFSSAANKVHIEEFRSQQGQRDAGERPEVEVAGALLNLRRKEQQSDDKQSDVIPPAPSLPVPTKPSKARSASVVSSVSGSEGNDTVLRNVVRDFFHTRFSEWRLFCRLRSTFLHFLACRACRGQHQRQRLAMEAAG
jgi:hypothetical protein